MNLKYKNSVISNLCYTLAAFAHIFLYEQFFTAVFLVILGIGSGVFHYYTAKYHEMKEKGLNWDKLKSVYKKMRFWQDVDIVSIYMIFAFYPYEITGNVWWLLWVIPMILLSLNKFDIIFPKHSTSSEKILGVCSVLTFILAFIYLTWWIVLLSLLAFGISIIFQFTGRKAEKEKDFKKHDNQHAGWHISTGTGFGLLG